MGLGDPLRPFMSSLKLEAVLVVAPNVEFVSVVGPTLLRAWHYKVSPILGFINIHLPEQPALPCRVEQQHSDEPQVECRTNDERQTHAHRQHFPQATVTIKLCVTDGPTCIERSCF